VTGSGIAIALRLAPQSGQHDAVDQRAQRDRTDHAEHVDFIGIVKRADMAEQ
jgi:hypothetical protein